MATKMRNDTTMTIRDDERFISIRHSYLSVSSSSSSLSLKVCNLSQFVCGCSSELI